MFKAGAVTAVLVGILVVAMFAAPVVAQNYWMHPGVGKGVSLEIFKPVFDYREDVDLLTSVWLLTGTIRQSDRLSLIVDCPVSSYNSDYVTGQTLLGNPYMGVEMYFPVCGGSARWVARFGGRPPMAMQDRRSAVYTGIWSLYNMFEAFYPDMAALIGGGGYRYVYPNGAEIRCNADAVFIIVTDRHDNELFFNYNAEWRQPVGKFTIASGIAGRMLASEDNIDFGERTEHYFGLAADVKLGRFRPGVHVRLPMEANLTHVVDFVYGVNLTIESK